MEFIELKHGSRGYQRVLQLRDAVLRKPLGLAFSESDISAERTNRHFALAQGEQVAACLMVVPHGCHQMQIRQMAVHPDLQGKGLGLRLMESVEALLQSEGFRGELFLHARESALGFYRKLGYVEEGGGFTEVGIPHLRMRKQIGPRGP